MFSAVRRRSSRHRCSYPPLRIWAPRPAHAGCQRVEGPVRRPARARRRLTRSTTSSINGPRTLWTSAFADPARGGGACRPPGPRRHGAPSGPTVWSAHVSASANADCSQDTPPGRRRARGRRRRSAPAVMGYERDQPPRPTGPIEEARAVERVKAGVTDRVGIADVVQPGGRDQQHRVVGPDGRDQLVGPMGDTHRVPPTLWLVGQELRGQLTGLAHLEGLGEHDAGHAHTVRPDRASGHCRRRDDVHCSPGVCRRLRPPSRSLRRSDAVTPGRRGRLGSTGPTASRGEPYGADHTAERPVTARLDGGGRVARL